MDAGFENVTILCGHSYDEALIGVTEDNQAVYDYDLMIEWLREVEGWSWTECVDWIEYNVIRAIPHMGENPPIILHRV